MFDRNNSVVLQMSSPKVLLMAAALVAVFVSGCAHTPRGDFTRNGSRSDLFVEPRSVPQVLVQSQDLLVDEVPAGKIESNSQPVTSQATSQPSEEKNTRNLSVQGVKLENTNFDYPVLVNSSVEKWVNYFTGRGRKHFAKYLYRSELFIPFIEPVLKKNGMPKDLVYLAMIESGFNNHAKSHAKAVGPWQFMPATGKRYGLQVNWWVDERRDTERSTLAAIEYLRDLYNIFGSWELAAAAYNAGEAKVARGLQRYGTRNFWSLARHRFLRPETRDYVPKIMAAAIIAKNRTQFGFPPSGANVEEYHFDAMPVGQATAENKNTSIEQILSKDGIMTASAVTTDLVDETADDSEGSGDGSNDDAIVDASTDSTIVADDDDDDDSDDDEDETVLVPHVDRSGKLSGIEMTEVEVQSPADLGQLAEAAQMTYQELKSYNPDLLRWCTPPQVETYKLQIPSSKKDHFVEAYSKREFKKQATFQVIKARKGDSLSKVAARFGLRVDPLSDLNRLNQRTSLRGGESIILPLPNDSSRTLASLDVIDPPEKKKRSKVKRKKVASSKKAFRVSYEERKRAKRKVPNRT